MTNRAPIPETAGIGTFRPAKTMSIRINLNEELIIFSPEGEQGRDRATHKNEKFKEVYRLDEKTAQENCRLEKDEEIECDAYRGEITLARMEAERLGGTAVAGDIRLGDIRLRFAAHPDILGALSVGFRFEGEKGDVQTGIAGHNHYLPLVNKHIRDYLSGILKDGTELDLRVASHPCRHGFGLDYDTAVYGVFESCLVEDAPGTVIEVRSEEVLERQVAHERRREIGVDPSSGS